VGKKIREVAKAMIYRPDSKVSQVMGNIARREKVHISKISMLVPADFKRPDPWKDLSYLNNSDEGISQKMDGEDSPEPRNRSIDRLELR